MSDRVDFYGLTPAELGETLGGSGRAKACWAAVRGGREPLEADDLGERARQRFRERCTATLPAVDGRRVAGDGTTKLLLQLTDDARVETVVIPGNGRTTVCVSSQVGCARGCTFCVTATLGLQRSLTAAEMVAQVRLADLEVRASHLPPLRNVVYMGMGEPLDNLDAVRRSIRILIDPFALALPARHVTTSTVGTSPRAIRAAVDLPGFLAWSVHAVEDDLRRTLVPRGKHSMLELRAAFVEIMLARKEILFVEMTLIDSVNDSLGHAEALAEFLEPLRPEVRVNLLPLNAGREGLGPTTDDRIVAFQQLLRDRGLFCATRRPRGADAAAACGQLAARVR